MTGDAFIGCADLPQTAEQSAEQLRGLFVRSGEAVKDRGLWCVMLMQSALMDAQQIIRATSERCERLERERDEARATIEDLRRGMPQGVTE